MGVKSWGMGDASPQLKIPAAGDVPPEIRIFQYFFLDTYKNFAFSNNFKIKWLKSEDKLDFGGRRIWVPMNLSPPQTKLCDNAPGIYCILKLIVRISALSEVRPFTLFPQNGAELHFNHGESFMGNHGER